MNWVWPMAPAHELTMLVAREVVVLHDAHGDEQLVAEIGMAVADKAKRRQRAEHVPMVLLGAEVGFDAPERDQDPALDAEFLFHRVEGLGPLPGLALAVGDAAAEAMALT